MSWQNQQVHCKFQQTIINDSDYYTQGGSALPSNTITTGDNINKFYDSSKIFLNNGTINIYIYNHYINFYHLDGNTMTPLGSDQLSSSIDTTFNGYAFIVDDDNEEGRIVSCVKDISSGEVTITQLTSSDYLSECYEAIKSIEARDYDGYVDFVKDTTGIFEIHDTLMRLAIGDISQLNTEDKTDIVSAINEVVAKPSGVQSDFTQNDNTQLDYIKHKPEADQIYKEFVGTTNEWSTLGLSDKLKYKIVHITDDYESGSSEDDVWGFIEHQDILNPAQRIEYIGANKNYTPVTINPSTGLANYGSWENFPFLTNNRPFMVKANGEADYMLSENNYMMKDDGLSASEVANSAYDGPGAFAWIPKIYRHKYIEGNDIYTMFSFTKRNPQYTADGFIDPNGNELEGVWIPMFYGTFYDDTTKMKSLALGNVYYTTKNSVNTYKATIEATSSRGVFLGGPIVDVIDDILTMLGKNNDIQSVFGQGNCSGFAGWYVPYNMKSNQCINGGKFYGTFTQTDANKVLHSMALLTFNTALFDPYVLVINGKIKVSRDYTFDLTGESYFDTGITYTGNINGYPSQNHIITGFGKMPKQSPLDGSTALGNADKVNIVKGDNVYTTTRFGYDAIGLDSGFRWMDISGVADPETAGGWTGCASIMVLPPVGYDPLSS